MDFTTNSHTFHSDTPTRPAKTSLTRHQPPPLSSSSYKECLKNHAASIGGHALDGCGEFMPSPTSTSTPTDPRSLKCAACGCHRNFHRRDSREQYPTPNFLTCFYSSGPPPPPLAPQGLSMSSSPSPNPTPSPMSSPSPPPLSLFPPPSYRSSACAVAVPHMMLSLGTGYSGPSDEQQQERRLNPTAAKEKPSGKKRCRTKFTQEQKERMCLFSEKLGWKMQKGDEDGMVQEFCKEIGVSRGVFKVWMHNNKNTFRMKKSETGNNNNNSIIGNDDDGGDDDNEKVNNVVGDGGFDSDINKDPFINSCIN